MNLTAFTGNSTATMSSKEIAALTGTRHDSAKRTIETLIEKGVISLPQIVEKPTEGRPSKEYVFSDEQGKRDSIIVVAQLMPAFTAKIIDRWQELESQHRKTVTISCTSCMELT